MSKQKPIAFVVPAALAERLDAEVVRRTVERRGRVTRSAVLRDALERGLGDADAVDALEPKAE